MADNRTHTYFFDLDVVTEVRVAVNGGASRLNQAIGGLDGPTLRFETSPVPETDVRVRNRTPPFTDPDRYGETRCRVPHRTVSYVCDRFEIMYIIGSIRAMPDTESRARAGCHELGHTLGLAHSEDPYPISCMSRLGPNGGNLNAHDIAHIRGYYDERNRAPIGHLDAVTPIPGGTAFQGWTLDLDQPDIALDIHVYGNGQFLTVAHAGHYRPDIPAAFPGAGYGAGFNIGIVSDFRGWNICLYAINVDALGRYHQFAGSNPLIGCAVATG